MAGSQRGWWPTRKSAAGMDLALRSSTADICFRKPLVCMPVSIITCFAALRGTCLGSDHCFSAGKASLFTLGSNNAMVQLVSRGGPRIMESQVRCVLVRSPVCSALAS